MENMKAIELPDSKEKKYTTAKEGDMLRIISLKDFSDVKKGDKGGLIKTEDNLS